MSWEIGIYRRWIFMKCPYCGDEMIRGYLMSSRDITFAVDNPTKVFFVLKNRTIWNWVKGQKESLIVKLIVVVVVRRFWLIMKIDKSLRKESKVVQTKKQYWDFSLTALSFASISIFSGWTKRVNSIWTFNSDTLFIIG